MSGLPRRIIKETQRLMAEPVPGISAMPDENNARYFHVVVAGPEGVSQNQQLDECFDLIFVSSFSSSHRSKAECSNWSCSCRKSIRCQRLKYVL